MNTMLLDIAQRVCWFEPPEKVLAKQDFFLCHLMTFGDLDDIKIAFRYYKKKDFLHALDVSPAGIFDKRSWVFWHTYFNKLPVPSMPTRF